MYGRDASHRLHPASRTAEELRKTRSALLDKKLRELRDDPGRFKASDEVLAKLWAREVCLEPIERDGSRDKELRGSDPNYVIYAIPLKSKATNAEVLTMKLSGAEERAFSNLRRTAYFNGQSHMVELHTRAEQAEKIENELNGFIHLLNQEVEREFPECREEVVSIIRTTREKSHTDQDVLTALANRLGAKRRPK